jgi:hypothetical protein
MTLSNITFSIMTHSITILIITTFSITTLSIMSLCIAIFTITTLSIVVTLSIAILSIMKLA